MRRTVVQIGLHQTAEYAYLAYPDWQERLDTVPEINRLPKGLFDSGDWFEYYGVDSDIYSITHCLEKHNHQGIHFVPALVHAEHDKGLKLAYSWFKEVSYWTPAVSLNQISEIAQGIDVLVVDVEGYEYYLFKEYGWTDKPKFLAIECHNSYYPDSISSSDICDMVISQGYQLHRKEQTNIGTPDHPKGTTEVQFVL